MERHAIARARERYGLHLTAEDLERAEQTIAAGESVIMRQVPGASSEHIMRIGGVAVRVVVSQSGYILTFLPLSSRFGRQGSGRRKNGKKKRRPRKR